MMSFSLFESQCHRTLIFLNFALIEQAEAAAKDLEHLLILARKEREQMRDLNEEHVAECKLIHQRTLAEAKEKYTKTCAEHDARITELSRSQADRLYSQLGEKTGARSLRTKVPFTDQEKSKFEISGRMIWVLAVIVGVSYCFPVCKRAIVSLTEKYIMFFLTSCSFPRL
jgi:hypothetical protein